MVSTVKINLDNIALSMIKRRLLVSALVACCLFMILGIVIQFSSVNQWETHWLWYWYPLHSPALDQLNLMLAHAGGLPVMLVIVLIISAWAFYKNRKDLSLFAAIALLGAAALGWLGKAGFSRVRPSVWERLTPYYGDSFPSNHSLYALTLAGIMLVLLYQTPWRKTAILLGLLWTLAMGMSRLYLGAHFPTDVLAGWSLGVGWLCFLVWIFIHFNLFQHRASTLAGNHEV